MRSRASALGHPTGSVVPVQRSHEGAVERPPASRWLSTYRRRLVIGDAVVAATAATTAYGSRFGPDSLDTAAAVYLSGVLVLPVLWALTLTFCRAYEHRVLGVGAEEFNRVAVAALVVIAGVSTASYAFQLELARGFVLIALPLTAALTLLWRYAARKRLHHRRTRGECQQRVVVVGHRGSAEALVRQISEAPYHGLLVAGVCLPDTGPDPLLDELDVPVLGDFTSIVEAVEDADADAVAVLPCPELDGSTLRRLGWQLEGTRAELLVAPAVMEVIGPRISIRPVCGLPLLHVERPEFEGVRRAAKAVGDRLAAVAALLALAPVLVVVGLAVALTSRGPVLFRQERVGRHGKRFTMYKFRTMVSDAEDLVVDLRDSDEGNGVLFKMKEDPRVTAVGRILRRYSLDELPQLLNVLLGHMSLVGPRPPLQSEVELYGEDMRRRLLVKPGLTGLWQISGRSDLSWDESVRLDLRYVENWSFAFDAMIIWKTIGAVLRSRGAY